MISVEKAFQLVKQHSGHLNPVSLSLEKVINHTLAEDVFAPISLPPFSQSAMDGYAIGAIKAGAKNQFNLIGEVKAGDQEVRSLESGEALRIFTGAMIPEGTWTIVIQEHTEVINDKVHVHQELKAGANIRHIGEQIKTGELALKKGTKLNPAAIGFLSSLGILEVKVLQKPKVGLIVTGNELVQPGLELKPGQIYESNSKMLEIALLSAGIKKIDKRQVGDNLQTTIEVISELIELSDILILSGGISVGDYDFVGQAIKQLGIEEIFYKVNQKPGKPLFFGKRDHQLVFALPGNPAAALTCFYEYILPSLQRLSGSNEVGLKKLKLPLKHGYMKKGNRAQFLKARVHEDGVEVLDGQSSAMLYSFASANALVYLPTEKAEIMENEMVEVHLLP